MFVVVVVLPFSKVWKFQSLQRHHLTDCAAHRNDVTFCESHSHGASQSVLLRRGTDAAIK